MSVICSIPDCGRGGKITRGWCRRHYIRWLTHGDPLHTERPTLHMDAAERLWSQVDRRGPDECWPWTGDVNEWGYGRINVEKRPAHRREYVHRLAYELLVGPVPEGLTVDHRCHTDDPSCPGGVCEHRRCCNPAHAEPVTFAENIRRQHRAVR